jgi:Uma2 family endonuclease
MATALDIRAQPLADFLVWEQQQPERYERVGGVVRMMTGDTIGHNRITRNCARALEISLQDSDCEVFTSDVKVTTPAEDVLYPDVVVACGEIAGKATRVEMPVVVVEVLSESTAERDHGASGGPIRRSRRCTITSWSIKTNRWRRSPRAPMTAAGGA